MEKKLTDDEVEAIIRAYVPQVVHMSLGTTNDGKPWVCEVHYAFDDDLNLYFRSLPVTRHCQDIAKNPQVAGSIVTQHFLNQAPRGVYFEGTAELLEQVSADHPAVTATSARFGADPEKLMAYSANGVRFYKVTPSSWYIFDAYVSRPAQQYTLNWPHTEQI
jgi:uncharacterized protein YhbP (UPF0306 family)